MRRESINIYLVYCALRNGKVGHMLKQNSSIKKIMSGRVGKILFTLLAAGLMFGGPTYMLYFLKRVVPFPYLEILAVVLFVVGLYLFLQVYEEEKQ